MTADDYPYIWTWGPSKKRTRLGEIPPTARVLDRKGQRCRVIARSGTMNSGLIEFEDGFRTVASRNGLRRADRFKRSIASASIRNVPQEKPKALPVRITADMIARIDKLRDPLVPRERYVRWLLDRALKNEERKQGGQR
jgi:hypothetical protein